MIIKKKQQNNRFLYYLRAVASALIPSRVYRLYLHKILQSIDKSEKAAIIARVDYYNKLAEKQNTNNQLFITARDLSLKNMGSSYYFDLKSLIRYFPDNYTFSYIPGDVTTIPDCPSFVKSRPISDHNQNAVLLKVDKIRHFMTVSDSIPTNTKKKKLMWRGNIEQRHRMDFFIKHFDNPLCDIGCIKIFLEYEQRDVSWLKPRLSIQEQLDYLFILSIEGHDVATNLKWIMSSHSVAVMPKPKYETWFMEGALIPDYHYVEINADYSNLNDRIAYFSENIALVEAIVKNANDYTKQFYNKKRERLISLMVMNKYFHLTQ